MTIHIQKKINFHMSDKLSWDKKRLHHNIISLYDRDKIRTEDLKIWTEKSAQQDKTLKKKNQFSIHLGECKKRLSWIKKWRPQKFPLPLTNKRSKNRKDEALY